MGRTHSAEPVTLAFRDFFYIMAFIMTPIATFWAKDDITVIMSRQPAWTAHLDSLNFQCLCSTWAFLWEGFQFFSNPWCTFENVVLIQTFWNLQTAAGLRQPALQLLPQQEDHIHLCHLLVFSLWHGSLWSICQMYAWAELAVVPQNFQFLYSHLCWVCRCSQRFLRKWGIHYCTYMMLPTLLVQKFLSNLLGGL